MVQIVYEVRQSGFQHGGLQEEHKTFKKPELQSAYDLSDLSTLWKKKIIKSDFSNISFEFSSS